MMNQPPLLPIVCPPPPVANPSFITGSFAYGTPTEKSDVDLVILVEPETMRILVDQFGDDGDRQDQDDYGNLPTASLRIGKLNLIVSIDLKHYKQWRDGTQELKRRAPVTRDQACAAFKIIREGKQ